MKRLIPMAVIFLAACSDEPPAVVLEISTDALIPGALSKIRIYLTASRNEVPEVCEPIMSPHWLDSEDDIPLRHAVFQGDEYSERLYYKIVGFNDLSDEPVYKGHLGDSSWPLKGEHPIPIILESACFNRDCDPGEQCKAGECVELEYPDLFNGSSHWDAGISCAASVEAL